MSSSSLKPAHPEVTAGAQKDEQVKGIEWWMLMHIINSKIPGEVRLLAILFRECTSFFKKNLKNCTQMKRECLQFTVTPGNSYTE